MKFKKTLVILYEFQIKNIDVFNFCKINLPNIFLNGYDLLIITSFDNSNYTASLNGNGINNFSVNPRFIEFESLNYALDNFRSNYDFFYYLNGSVFSKHSTLLTNYLLNDINIIGLNEDLPCMIGRVDSFPNYFIKSGMNPNFQFISTFFFGFNRKSAYIFYGILKNFDKVDLNGFLFYKLIVNNLLKNSNYKNSDGYIMQLKCNSCMIENMFSDYFFKNNIRLFSFKYIGSTPVMFFEFFKNFIFKRFIYLRSFLKKI